MVARGAMAGTFRSLQHRNARLFFVGLAVSNVGSWMQLTAMSLLVYELTGRATDLGLTVAFQFLPMLALGAWAGAIADRHDRRRMTMLTQTGLAVQALVLGVLDLAGLATLPVVWTAALVLGVVNAFDNPARRSLVTELVEEPDISNAVSLNTAVMTGSRIFGPALAAALVDPLGTGWLFVLNGVSFAAILAALAAIDPSKLFRTPRAARGGTPVRDALRFIGHRRTLAVIFVMFTVISTFSFNYYVTLPKLADQRWGETVVAGWLLAVTSVGSVIGSLLTASRPMVTLRWFFASALVLGAASVALAWAPNLASAFALTIPVGAGGAAFIAGVNSITQQSCPPEMRSRIMALTAVAFLGSTPIGGPLTGWIGDTVSAEWALAYGGVVALASTAVAAWMLWPSRRPVELATPSTVSSSP